MTGFADSRPVKRRGVASSAERAARARAGPWRFLLAEREGNVVVEKRGVAGRIAEHASA
jgi:hypothetical protein